MAFLLMIESITCDEESNGKDQDSRLLSVESATSRQYRSRSLRKWKYPVHPLQFYGFLRHSKNNGSGFILSNVVRTGLLHFEHPARTRARPLKVGGDKLEDHL
jgi:hypothetical protein